MKVEQISSQFYLVVYEDDGKMRILSGPYPTREQAETMTKAYDL